MISSKTKAGNTALIAGSIAALIAINLVIWRKKQRQKESLYPPTPPIGMGETIEKVSSPQYPSFMLHLAKITNSYTFRLKIPVFGYPMVVAVGDLATHRAVLKDSETIRPIDPFYKAFNDITGGVESIFTTNGDYWHKRRKLLSPSFSSRHVGRMNQVAQDKVKEWIERKLRPLSKESKSFDVAEEMLGVILAAICETAFQYQISAEEEEGYNRELDICLKEFLFKSTANPLRPLLGRLLPERRRAHQAAESLMEFANTIMQHYKKLESPIKDTLIDRIMNSDVYSNDRERQADIVFLLFAGHDTTALSLSWTLLELAKHPQHVQSVRESLSQLPPNEWGSSNALGNVLKEGMRLHPATAAGSIRQINKDIQAEGGFLLPKGSAVILPLILLFRNPDIYTNPDIFDPNRWVNSTTEMVDAHLPFSLGKQNCLGQALARVELQSIIGMICSEFDLEVEDEGTSTFFLTYKPVGARLIATQARSVAKN